MAKQPKTPPKGLHWHEGERYDVALDSAKLYYLDQGGYRTIVPVWIFDKALGKTLYRRGEGQQIGNFHPVWVNLEGEKVQVEELLRRGDPLAIHGRHSRPWSGFGQPGRGYGSFGGYTQYWNHWGFTAAQWQKLLAATKKIIAAAKRDGITIAGPDGTGRPVLSSLEISLNGAGSDAHETFFLTRAPQEFEFCKTREKPYDAVVVSILAAAAQINKKFEPSSDGGPDAIRRIY